MRRRELLTGAAALTALSGCATPAPGAGSAGHSPDAPLSRIAFVSCMDQTRPAPIWDTIVAEPLDLFVFGGDNIYCEMPYSLARSRDMPGEASAIA
jgi:alkaline phosphatase D